eukprot:gene966-819_t
MSTVPTNLQPLSSSPLVNSNTQSTILPGSQASPNMPSP